MKLFTRIKMFFEMIRILRIRGVVRDKGWRWVLVETYRECFRGHERKLRRIDLAEFRHKYGPIWPTPIGGGFQVPSEYEEAMRQYAFEHGWAISQDGIIEIPRNDQP